MAFKKGDAKPVNSGRKAGTPHKKSLFVREILENHGINLAEQIVVRLPKLSALEQVRALTALLPYVYPKLSSVEHSGEILTNPYMDKPLNELKALVLETVKIEE